jgi:hypothetical protein
VTDYPHKGPLLAMSPAALPGLLLILGCLFMFLSLFIDHGVLAVIALVGGPLVVLSYLWLTRHDNDALPSITLSPDQSQEPSGEPPRQPGEDDDRDFRDGAC